MTNKRFIRPAVCGAAAFLLLLNMVLPYLYSTYFGAVVNGTINDVASVSCSMTMLLMLILSAAILAVLIVKYIYDYFKKQNSVSFWNWASIGLLLCFVVSIGNFMQVFSFK